MEKEEKGDYRREITGNRERGMERKERKGM